VSTVPESVAATNIFTQPSLLYLLESCYLLGMHDLEDRPNCLTNVYTHAHTHTTHTHTHTGLIESDDRVQWFWQSVSEMTRTPRDTDHLFRLASVKKVLPNGGFGDLAPKFNVVSSESSDKVDIYMYICTHRQADRYTYIHRYTHT